MMPYVLMIVTWGDGEAYAGCHLHSIRFTTHSGAQTAAKALKDGNIECKTWIICDEP